MTSAIDLHGPAHVERYLETNGAEGFHWGGHYQAASMPSILRSGAVGTAIFPPSLMFGIWPARHAS